VVTTLILIFCIVIALSLPFMAWLMTSTFNKQREEWNTERSKLLDRIQAGSFNEYKAQERAEIPIKRREKDELTKKLEREPWL